MSKDGKIWLSHSGIETLNRCPRCFWIQYKRGIRQPEGIVSKLANRFDTVMKNYFNIFRDQDKIPDLIQGKIEGKLQNPFKEKYFTRINDEFGFWGKLDECLINDRNEYIPVDFKTASTDPRGRETLSAYQSQIDDYMFLLEQDGKQLAGFGYLIYVYPDEGKNLHLGFPMIIHIVKVTGYPKNTIGRINKAIEVLNAPMPSPHPNCVFCNWYLTIRSETKDSADEKIITLPKKKNINKKVLNSLQTSFMDFDNG